MLRCQLKMWAIHNEQRIKWYTEGGGNIEIANDDIVKSIRRAAMSNSDIFKKATTDALTKGLSMLGFNADVFMGLWNDNDSPRIEVLIAYSMLGRRPSNQRPPLLQKFIVACCVQPSYIKFRALTPHGFAH